MQDDDTNLQALFQGLYGEQQEQQADSDSQSSSIIHIVAAAHSFGGGRPS
jgi:hypothetical protein